jgi:hypothetical protein
VSHVPMGSRRVASVCTTVGFSCSVGGHGLARAGKAGDESQALLRDIPSKQRQLGKHERKLQYSITTNRQPARYVHNNKNHI